MKSVFFPMLLVVFSCRAENTQPMLEIQKAGDDYRIVQEAQDKTLALTKPNAWQGNVEILSPLGIHAGVLWPHFLMHSEGNWLTDKVESEGMKLLDFDILLSSGPLVGYRARWTFRDYFTSSETHFVWFDADNSVQVHWIRTELQVLRDLEHITAVWVEFMTRENSFTTVATKRENGTKVTMDVGKTGAERNMHYWHEYRLAETGWITIFGSKSGQTGCAVLVPLASSQSPVRPRVNNGHVDNIELHILDPRTPDTLKKGAKLFLEYLLLAGPDNTDVRWIDPAVERARDCLERHENLVSRRVKKLR